PFGLRHLVVDAPDHGRELERQATGADQHVRLAWGEGLPLHAEAREVEPAGGGGHELDGAACGPEWHRPERVGARRVHRPVDEILKLGEQVIRALDFTDVSHALNPTGTLRASRRRRIPRTAPA